MSEHTPGPWHIVRPQYDQASGRLFVEMDAEGFSTTSLLDPADAYLVSAAPELLAACRAALVMLDRDHLDILSDTADLMRAAIAKAEGREA